MTMRFAGVAAPDVNRSADSGILGAMGTSAPRRTALFAADPIGELRGLVTVTDPDDDVSAVIDLAVIGARGDGKTQFIVHAIRALHAHAPGLDGAEQDLNRDIMRLVLDPRATRPEATPPGVLPHFTFRIRAGGLFDRLGLPGALRFAIRAARIGVLLVLAVLLAAAGVAAASHGEVPVGVIGIASGAIAGALAALIAKRRVGRFGDVELVFWDVAGEQVYSAAAADYYAVLARLIDARRRRAEQLGRAYVFAPVLICNPLALGTEHEGSAYERLRQLLPLFAALDSEQALVAINRWSIVDPICARGAPRDEEIRVTAHGRGEPAPDACAVAREKVRASCLDAEDGRDGDLRIAYLRYDTALHAAVEVDRDAGTVNYEYDDGPGAFSGEAPRKFVSWVVDLIRWHRPAPAPVSVPVPDQPASAVSAPPIVGEAPQEVWARPR